MADKWKIYAVTILAVLLIAVVAEYSWYTIVYKENVLTAEYKAYSQIGKVDIDHGIISGSNEKPGFVAFIPYITRFSGKYQASFKVYLGPNTIGSKDPESTIGFCDVIFKDLGPEQHRYVLLKVKDFIKRNPLEVNVNYNNTIDYNVTGLRLYQTGKDKLSLVGLQVIPDSSGYLFGFGNNPVTFLFILILGWVLYQVQKYEPNNALVQPNFVVQKIRPIFLITVSGFIVAIVYHFITGVIGHHSWPQNTFLYMPTDRFMDYYHAIYVPFQDIKNHLNPYAGHWYPVPYFPVSFFLAAPWALFSSWQVNNSFYIISVTAFFMVFLYTQIDQISNVFHKLIFVGALVFTSYPLLFLLDRGNNEGVLFILLALFISFYLKKEYFKSSIILGLAIGMKLYPAVFLILLLKDKKYKEIMISIASTVVFTIIAVITIGFPAAAIYKEISRNLAFFQTHMVTTLAYVSYNHSFYNLANHVLGNLLGIVVNYRMLTNSYLLIAFTIFAAMGCFILRYDLKNWEKVAVLTIAMIFLPYLSSDYTLIHLYLPFLIFINEPKPDKTDLAIAILFSLLVIPKNYFGIDPKAPLGVILNPLLALAVLAIVVKKHTRRLVQA